jgi:hypothetical protein
MRRSIPALVLMITLCVGACTKLEVEDQAIQFNEGTGESSAQLVLLNAVRASKDYPLQFSRIQSMTGKGAGSFEIGSQLPFDALRLGASSGTSFATLSPKLTYGSTVSQLNLVDLNTEEAQQQLKRQIDSNQFRYYWLLNGGRSQSVVLAMLVQEIALHEELFTRINEIAQSRCDKNAPEDKNAPIIESLGAVCDEMWSLAERCPNIFSRNEKYGKQLYRVFRASVASECEYKQMRYAGFLLLLSEFRVSPIERSPSDEKKPRKTEKAGENVFNIYTTESEKSGDKGYEFSASFVKDDELTKIAKKLDKKAYNIVFRSPESMVRYLGDLIAVQNYRRDGFIPTIFNPSIGREIPLFRVKRGVPGRNDATMTVSDHEHEAFYIPRPAYGELDRDRSMETLSLVADVLNGAVSKKAFPQVNTFTLSAP